MKLDLSKELRYMIAKSDRTDHDGWLPFYVHALDTAEMVKKLVHHYGLDTEWAHIYGVDRVKFLQALIFIALIHDMGKLTAAFQHMIAKSLPESFTYDGIPQTAELERGISPHPLAGESILLHLGVSGAIASVVGAHHGMPSRGNEARNDLTTHGANYYGRPAHAEFWESIWSEWLKFALETAGFKSVDELPVPEKGLQALISGLIVTADWLASDNGKFPLFELDKPPMNEYDDSRIENAWSKLALPSPWCPETYLAGGLYEEYFGFDSPNDIQKTVTDIAERTEEPGIFIVEAPMGCGKTELALVMAELFAQRNDKHGVFFGLPTQTTANGIFDRFMGWAEKQSEEFHHSIVLAHSNAHFQPAFENLPRRMPDVDADSGNGVFVHPFFMGAKQSCMSEFVAGTVDRLLMAALKRRHVMLLHFGLSQKVVIIDECHAYDAYMNVYLERAIKWMSEYNVPVILLSATLPPSRRKALISAYTGVKRMDIENETAYPMVTWSDGGKVYSKAIEYKHENKDVAIEHMNERDAAAAAIKAAENGACVGVICNTVRKAQALCAEIETKHEKHILYHAQYIMPDRAEKEAQILKMAGKRSSTEERRGLIVIGTQVLEQSLDIDFDLLITELCPMDLLLQRIGRLFRHKEHERPVGYDSAKCIVLRPDEGGLDEGSEAVYGKWLLMQTEKYLPDRIAVPDDISGLVYDVYERADAETDEEEDAYEAFLEGIKDKKNRAKGYRMGPPDKSANATLNDWLEQGVSDSGSEAAVRDSDPAIEALLMIRDGDRAGFLPWLSEGEKISVNECPDERICRKIARQRLRLPRALSYDGIVDKTIKEIEKRDEVIKKWQTSHWLKGELILFLDRDLKTELMDYELEYSRDKGLRCKKAKEAEN